MSKILEVIEKCTSCRGKEESSDPGSVLKPTCINCLKLYQEELSDYNKSKCQKEEKLKHLEHFIKLADFSLKRKKAKIDEMEVKYGPMFNDQMMIHRLDCEKKDYLKKLDLIKEKYSPIVDRELLIERLANNIIGKDLVIKHKQDEIDIIEKKIEKQELLLKNDLALYNGFRNTKYTLEKLEYQYKDMYDLKNLDEEKIRLKNLNNETQQRLFDQYNNLTNKYNQRLVLSNNPQECYYYDRIKDDAVKYLVRKIRCCLCKKAIRKNTLFFYKSVNPNKKTYHAKCYFRDTGEDEVILKTYSSIRVYKQYLQMNLRDFI